MSYYNLDDLEVYQLAEGFGDEIWFLVHEWDYFAKDTLGKQISRSADSISANIAEGYGRYHYKENRKLLLLQSGIDNRNQRLVEKMQKSKTIK